jgi:hypothetical protein
MLASPDNPGLLLMLNGALNVTPASTLLEKNTSVFCGGDEGKEETYVQITYTLLLLLKFENAIFGVSEAKL